MQRDLYAFSIINVLYFYYYNKKLNLFSNSTDQNWNLNWINAYCNCLFFFYIWHMEHFINEFKIKRIYLDEYPLKYVILFKYWRIAMTTIIIIIKIYATDANTHIFSISLDRMHFISKYPPYHIFVYNIILFFSFTLFYSFFFLNMRYEKSFYSFFSDWNKSWSYMIFLKYFFLT